MLWNSALFLTLNLHSRTLFAIVFVVYEEHPMGYLYGVLEVLLNGVMKH